MSAGERFVGHGESARDALATARAYVDSAKQEHARMKYFYSDHHFALEQAYRAIREADVWLQSVLPRE